MGIIFNLPIKKKRVIQTLVFIIMAFLEHSHQFVKKKIYLFYHMNLSFFLYILFIFYILHTYFLKYFTSYYLHSWGEVVIDGIRVMP